MKNKSVRFIPIFIGLILLIINISFLCLLYVGLFSRSTMLLLFCLSLMFSLFFIVFCFVKRHAGYHLKSSVISALLSIGISFVFVFTDTGLNVSKSYDQQPVFDMDELELSPVSEDDIILNRFDNYGEYPYLITENKYLSSDKYLSFNSYLFRVGEYQKHYIFEYVVKIEIQKSFIFKRKDTLYISSYSSTAAYPSSYCHLYLNDDMTTLYEPEYIGKDYIRYQFPIIDVETITANYFFIATDTSNVSAEYIHNQNIFYSSLPFGQKTISQIPTNSYHSFTNCPTTVPALYD